MQFSSKIQQCHLSPMRKFHPYALKAEARGLKIHHLNIGQPDIPTPPAFFDAVHSYRSEVLAYAPSPGVPAYVEAVQRYYQRIGAPLAEENILATTGGSEALQMAMSCILDEGDEILIPEPFYTNYNTFVRVAGGQIRPIHSSPEEGYRYAERGRIEPLITERTKAILVTNPGNPTGTVLTPEEMQVIAGIAREHGLFLVADEVYREFVYGGEPLSTFLTIPGIEENLIVVDSVSKRFSACGARVGALISRNPDFIGQAMKLCQGRLCSATLDQLGAAALYSVEPDYFNATRDEYRRRRNACVEGLHQIPGVVCEEPKGAFYLMAKLPVDDADRFQTWLLEEFEDHGETLMFAPGEGFYATPGKGKDEIRIAYVLNEADIRRSMELLGIAIARYRKEKMA